MNISTDTPMGVERIRKRMPVSTLTDSRILMDTMGMMQQLGVVPS